MTSLLYNDVQRVFCFVLFFIERQQNTERKKKDFWRTSTLTILHMMATDCWHMDEEQNLHIPVVYWEHM